MLFDNIFKTFGDKVRLFLAQMKNMLGRFVRARRELTEDVRRQLEEMVACG